MEFCPNLVNKLTFEFRFRVLPSKPMPQFSNENVQDFYIYICAPEVQIIKIISQLRLREKQNSSISGSGL